MLQRFELDQKVRIKYGYFRGEDRARLPGESEPEEVSIAR
jgi:hypothetical protein